ncbi:hypothetical protein [Mucilaginibacter antarcticus]|uniref:Uncharacterized protein n=1 Tax=Mucilaginibacter antarcticus TaxID=1855725 RepID=A0ABW5XQ06_9SPHI
MEKMKSLADQLREQMVKPGEKLVRDTILTTDRSKTPKSKVNKVADSTILQALIDYDNSDHKTLAHFRCDKQTVEFMNKFKLATGVDVTKFVAFSVRHFIEAYPELKIIIKQYMQNSNL